MCSAHQPSSAALSGCSHNVPPAPQPMACATNATVAAQHAQVRGPYKAWPAAPQVGPSLTPCACPECRHALPPSWMQGHVGGRDGNCAAAAAGDSLLRAPCLLPPLGPRPAKRARSQSPAPDAPLSGRAAAATLSDLPLGPGSAVVRPPQAQHAAGLCVHGVPSPFCQAAGEGPAGLPLGVGEQPTRRGSVTGESSCPQAMDAGSSRQAAGWLQGFRGADSSAPGWLQGRGAQQASTAGGLQGAGELQHSAPVVVRQLMSDQTRLQALLDGSQMCVLTLHA
jgi:hypothetical protein